MRQVERGDAFCGGGRWRRERPARRAAAARRERRGGDRDDGEAGERELDGRTKQITKKW